MIELLEDPRIRLVLVVGSTIALQRGVMSHLTFFGVAPNLLMLAAIAAGLSTLSDRGLIVGFACGLGYDFVTQGPLGLGALTFSLVAYAANRLQAGFVRSSRLLPVVAGTLLTAAGELAYVAFGQIIGQSQMLGDRLGRIVAVTAAVNAVLAPPMVRAMTWAFNERSAFRTLHY